MNLFTDMWDLLLKFRCNRFILLEDIWKAFLIIGLNREPDKNCFCFFVKIKDRLVCFRYRTHFWVSSQSFYPQFYYQASCAEVLY